MPNVLYIGGPKHGHIEDIEHPSSHITIAVSKPISLAKVEPEELWVPYTTVVYKFKGIWHATKGYLEIYVTPAVNFVSAKLKHEVVNHITYYHPKSIFVLDTVYGDAYTLVDFDVIDNLAKDMPYDPVLEMYTPVVNLPKENFMSSIMKANAIMKQTYIDLLYQGHLTIGKAQELLGIEAKYNPVVAHAMRAWMSGGFWDAPKTGLCYWCAEELIGPGAGKVNDLRVDVGKGKSKRKLNCRWCGYGVFSRKGERITVWNPSDTEKLTKLSDS